MNYFERLVRRATARPAGAPGLSLHDPFEQTADWPLDPPPAPPVVASTSPPGVPAPDAVPTERAVVEANRSTAVAPPRELTPPSPRSAVEGDRTPPMPLRGDEDNGHVDRVTLSPPAEMPPSPSAAPLDRADHFMRSLGVPLPEPVEAPIAPTAVVPSPIAQAAPPPAPAIATPQSVRPPAPPPVLPPPSSMEARPTPPASSASAEPAASKPSPAERPPSRIDTRRVVIVEKTARVVAGPQTPPSGGAPYFGLGQL